jgi:hypothetical protein
VQDSALYLLNERLFPSALCISPLPAAGRGT